MPAATRLERSRAFEVLDDLADDYGRFFKVRCENCGNVDLADEETWLNACEDMDRRAQRQGRVGRTRYPYIEPHSGILVNSADDRERVMKSHGFHSAEHGIDSRHNDELADKLKDRERHKKEKRKNARRAIREAARASRVS